MQAFVTIKALIKENSPRIVFNILRNVYVKAKIRNAYRYDESRFIKFSSSIEIKSKENLQAAITEKYHNIEKGLSLPNPRAKFGATQIEKLILLTNEYIRKYENDFISSHAILVLNSYLAFNREHGIPDEQIPKAKEISELSEKHKPQNITDSGTITITKEYITSQIEGLNENFFFSRFSTRQFDDSTPSVASIEYAARVAAKSPAVCNRQFSRIRTYLNKTEIKQLLEIQGGARGFIDDIHGLAIITVNTKTYWGEGERNQGWIDGGLFAMSFMLGLHAKGLGSVALNWSKPPADDKRLRAATNISESEIIIMLVGFGNLKDSYEVAVSPRLPINKILEIKK